MFNVILILAVITGAAFAGAALCSLFDLAEAAAILLLVGILCLIAVAVLGVTGLIGSTIVHVVQGGSVWEV